MNSINQSLKSSNPDIDLYIFLFALNYSFWHITVAFLNIEIKNQFMVAELFDFFTPVVMTLLIVKLFFILLPAGRFWPRVNKVALIILFLGIIFFIEGHGMHLSANAITRHLAGKEYTDIFKLTYFFDEILGHLLWDGGFILISIGFICSVYKEAPPIQQRNWKLLIPASLLYGFTMFCMAVEGQTVAMTLPVSIVFLLFLSPKVFMKARDRVHSIIVFYLISYAVGLLLFIYWFVRNNGFPEFSELGWI
ncbi:hypothetical protein BVY01_00325 [bacterium I07]|nr:hypothetical protein BVY01_00325 [bacterium I07]